MATEVITLAYDGITMAAVLYELQRELEGTRVERISQPGNREIIIQLRSRDKSAQLLCSADSRHARVHLTTEKQENPAVAPAFCMLLRKHLNGARLLRIEQAGLERVITFTFRGMDDFGYDTEKTLICEVMGKHSNLILTAPGEDGPYILGAVKNVTDEMSRHRAVVPGEPYIPPPFQDKLDLFHIEENSLAERMAGLAELPASQILSAAVLGIGPDTAAEITTRAAGPEQAHPLEMTRALTVELRKLAETVHSGRFSPCIGRRPGAKPVFSPILLTSLPTSQLELCQSVNQGLDLYYHTLLRTQREGELKRQLLQAGSVAYARAQKKQRLQQQELSEAESADRYRIWAEMLTASNHLLRPGSKEAEVPDYYSENQGTIRIPLNPAYSGQENARRYFKKYRKLKDGARILSRRLQETREELAYLESLLTSLDLSDLDSLHEIREEMEQAGIVRAPRTKKKAAAAVSEPLHFVSADGIDIFVGRNNRQNDRLTLRYASAEDLWLHTKDIPGAHVIIRHPDPPPSTLTEAAILAARYSKASASQNVPVDYTKVRHVHKPKGAKPGMVIYTHQRTLYVTP
jgi:predicted ribosome quality control (RQC) complex YloA/Tae2 family protein